MKYSALALLLAARAFAAEAGLPDFLPPATKVMFGIQLRRILDSSLVQGLNPATAAGALSGAGALPGAASLTADWQKIVNLAGFDPLKDIDEVLIASTGQGEKPPMLVVARGNFNFERFSANARLYHSVPVLATAGSSTGTIALFDASTAILGEVAEVHAAIDRRGGHATLNQAVASTASSYRERYEVWGLGDLPANLARSAQSPQLNQLDSIDRFRFGVSITHGLELMAELHARSAEDAQKLKQAVQLLEFMMKSRAGAADSPKLDVHEDHGTIKVALAISEAELKKAIEKGQRAALEAQKAAPAPRAQTKPGYNGPMVFTLPGK